MEALAADADADIGDAGLHLASASALRLAKKRMYRALLRTLDVEPDLARESDAFGMTPLHWICTDPRVPVDVVEQVVNAYTDAAATENLAGLLPLHLAIRKNLSLDVIKVLVQSHPRGVLSKTPDERTVTALADTHLSSHAAKVFLRMIEQQVYESVRRPPPSNNLTSTTTPSPIIHTPSMRAEYFHRHAVALRTTEVYVPPPWQMAASCSICASKFTYFRTRHHCRNCGDSVCGRHSKHAMPLQHLGLFRPQRVCNVCHTHLGMPDEEELHHSRVHGDPTFFRGAARTPVEEFRLKSLKKPMLTAKHRSLSATDLPTRYSSVSQAVEYPLVSPHRFASEEDDSVPSSAESGAVEAPLPPMKYPVFIKFPSITTTHLSAATRHTSDSKLESNETATPPGSNRPDEMRRRGHRLVETDIETVESSSPGSYLDGEATLMHQDLEDMEHVLHLEARVKKLVIAKQQLNHELEQQLEAELAESQQKRYDALAKAFEEHNRMQQQNEDDDDDRPLGDTSQGTSGSSDIGDEEPQDERLTIGDLETPARDEDNQKEDEEEDEDEDEVSIEPSGLRPAMLLDELDQPLDVAATRRDLGIVYLARQDFVSASVEFKKSLNLDENNAATWYQLAKALDGANEHDDAENAIRRSIALQPQSLPSLSLLGKILNARGDHEQAIDVFREALRLQCHRKHSLEVEHYEVKVENEQDEH